MRPRGSCVGWGTWLRLGSENLRVIISAVSWGLACFPAVSGTGKGRQYRDVIREGGGLPVEIPSPGRKTMCLALPNWERAPLGVGGEGRGGSEPERLCLGLTALAEGEVTGCPSILEALLPGTGWHRCIPCAQYVPASPSCSGGELCCLSKTLSC